AYRRHSAVHRRGRRGDGQRNRRLHRGISELMERAGLYVAANQRDAGERQRRFPKLYAHAAHRLTAGAHLVLLKVQPMDSITAPEGFRHHQPIQVRWGDMDAFGHVNNAVFLTYIEHARIQYARGLDLWGGGRGSLGMILAHIEMDFK